MAGLGLRLVLDTSDRPGAWCSHFQTRQTSPNQQVVGQTRQAGLVPAFAESLSEQVGRLEAELGNWGLQQLLYDVPSVCEALNSTQEMANFIRNVLAHVRLLEARVLTLEDEL